MSMVGHIVFYYIPSAWASALLILSQRQCESLNKRDKQSSRFPRSFYMLPPTQLSLQRQVNRVGKKLHPTRIREKNMGSSNNKKVAPVNEPWEPFARMESLLQRDRLIDGYCVPLDGKHFRIFVADEVT